MSTREIEYSNVTGNNRFRSEGDAKSGKAKASCVPALRKLGDPQHSMERLSGTLCSVPMGSGPVPMQRLLQEILCASHAAIGNSDGNGVNVFLEKHAKPDQRGAALREKVQ